MTLEGTVVNGVIVLDAAARLPEGMRVRVELVDADELAPPTELFDRERELAALRESLADAHAGRSRLARDVLREIATRHGLPLEPGE
ncbi:MAG: hypothetical protein U0736_15555 [Gemmataceae bacterium]